MAIKAEQLEMIKIFDYLKFHGADTVSFHVANERSVSPQHGAILKRTGVTKGVPDIFVMMPARGFHGLAIELKVKPNKPTPEQLKFLETLNSNGYLAVVRYSADEAIKTIENYLHIDSSIDS